MIKTCSSCGDRHPVELFNRDCTRSDGRDPRCKYCTRSACRASYRRHETKHRALKQRWKDGNRDRHRQINRQWQLANPEKVRQGAARYKARLKRATPPWADLELIDFIRAECPKGWHVDHIHPLAGDKFCGLNVPWNLQYLPPEVHWRKGTKLPVDAEDQVQSAIP